MFFSDQAKSYEMLIAGRLVIGICAGNTFKLLQKLLCRHVGFSVIQGYCTNIEEFS